MDQKYECLMEIAIQTFRKIWATKRALRRQNVKSKQEKQACNVACNKFDAIANDPDSDVLVIYTIRSSLEQISEIKFLKRISQRWCL